MKILIVEDEPKAGDYLRQGLREAGFAVELVTNGVDGLHHGLEGDHDLVILDVMLPGMDGWQVLKNLRSQGRQMPVLFLTARDQIEDRVKGLELGADDYLVKPFALAELEARIEALLRRSQPIGESLLRFADLVLDVANARAVRAGQPLALTPTELKLLETLLRAAPRLVRRSELERVLWPDLPPDSDALRTHIHGLRQAVDRPFASPLIETVRGLGYRLCTPDVD